MSYERRVGEHLRSVRRGRGLSLHDVETASGNEFKVSVLGAYERGERSLSIGRLARLARVYQVPVAALLPEAGAPAGGVTVDLDRLRASDAPEAAAVMRCAEAIRKRRRDWTGRILSIRADDVELVAAALDRPQMAKRLEELGVTL